MLFKDTKIGPLTITPVFNEGDIMLFKNPLNDYMEYSASSLSWLWLLLLGPLYWVVRGVWPHAVAHLVLIFCTSGVSHFVYPFFTYSILRNFYLKKGWVQVKAENISLKQE